MAYCIASLHIHVHTNMYMYCLILFTFVPSSNEIRKLLNTHCKNVHVNNFIIIMIFIVWDCSHDTPKQIISYTHHLYNGSNKAEDFFHDF